MSPADLGAIGCASLQRCGSGMTLGVGARQLQPAVRRREEYVFVFFLVSWKHVGVEVAPLQEAALPPHQRGVLLGQVKSLVCEVVCGMERA